MERYAKIPLNSHNKRAIRCAMNYADSMHNNPSYLEKKMMNLLDKLGVHYRFQWVLFILSEDAQIEQFYIADFYIPKVNVIIEVDGKFHKDQADKDNRRVEDIHRHYPDIDILRWDNDDFSSEESMALLFRIVNGPDSKAEAR